METSEIRVTGTLMWYYYICHRQVWLMARRIDADQGNPDIDIGRFLHERAYAREKKEVTIGHLKFDLIKKQDGQLVVGEVKKSSKAEHSAKMQLALYLTELAGMGVEVSGELLFPKEKKRVPVHLTQQLIEEVERAKKDILRIAYLDLPPPPVKGRYCRNCAYGEFCWA
ncbi:MAG: CRISPR-associated protein Cas4 [Bacillota bacterium]